MSNTPNATTTAAIAESRAILTALDKAKTPDDNNDVCDGNCPGCNCSGVIKVDLPENLPSTVVVSDHKDGPIVTRLIAMNDVKLAPVVNMLIENMGEYPELKRFVESVKGDPSLRYLLKQAVIKAVGGAAVIREESIPTSLQAVEEINNTPNTNDVSPAPTGPIGQPNGEMISLDHNRLATLHFTGTGPLGIDYPPGHSYIAVNMDNLNPLGEINFQNGPVKDNGVNGWTNEALLALLIHRTEILNQNFPAPFNVEAIEHMKLALAAFESRTKDRLVRGVEGTNTL